MTLSCEVLDKDVVEIFGVACGVVGVVGVVGSVTPKFSAEVSPKPPSGHVCTAMYQNTRMKGNMRIVVGCR